MAGVYLMASRPGAFTKEGLIEGNPEVKDDAYTPTGSFSKRLTLTEASKKRLLSVVTDVAVEILQLAENETPSSYAGVPTTVPAPSSGQTSYACFLHPSTVGVYVKTA